VSSTEQKERFRKYSPELELLLWAVWDPIGGVPLDEHGRHVPDYPAELAAEGD